MNAMTVIGTILIVVGAVGLIYGGITYTSSRHVIDVGSVHLKVDDREPIPLSPITGAVALVAGVGLVVMGRRQPGRGKAS